MYISDYGTALTNVVEKIEIYHDDTTHQQKTVQSIVHLSMQQPTFYCKKPQQEQTMLVKNKILLIQSNTKQIRRGARYVEKGCHTTYWVAVRAYN